MAIFARNSGNMEELKQIDIESYNYELPDERIPHFPLKERDSSKLLQYKNGIISDHQFSDIVNLLPIGTMMFFNNSKVIRARIEFFKTTGARVEIFCLEPHKPSEYQLAFQVKGAGVWRCMVGNLKKWKEGRLTRQFKIDGVGYELHADYLSLDGKDHIIQFTWDDTLTFASVIDACGRIPIPPYLKRDSEASDLITYQTVYAKVKGSVAAPTAGLHFTPDVLTKLAEKGIKQEEVTLHVGAGTFQPVKEGAIGNHEMHAETIIINRETILSLLSHSGAVVPVGTTSVRTLESLYWLGVSLINDPSILPTQLFVGQWDPYRTETMISKNESLQALLNYMEKHDMSIIQAITRIMIAPGYQFRIAKGIITNFHQPKSTLLLLISALIGDNWRKVYAHALASDYRFLSYGDSSILWL